LENPAIPPSLWKLFGGNNISGKSRNRAHGLAIAPDEIVICPKQPAREALDTKIHEALHLLLPDASEAHIIGYSKRLTDLLWRDGYRRVER
jgi:hypothetical protein